KKRSLCLKKLPMEELGMLKLKRLLKAQRPKSSRQRSPMEIHQTKIVFIFISRKIQSMWKHKRGSRWKNNFKKHTKETKDKTQVVYYECKKSGHFTSECPNLEKEKEKEKKKPLIEKKKSLMTT
ncbi:hypothetical protein CR513_30476, partial [Mucuna pruriens]